MRGWNQSCFSSEAVENGQRNTPALNKSLWDTVGCGKKQTERDIFRFSSVACLLGAEGAESM